MLAFVVQSVPQRREIRKRLLAGLPPSAVVVEDDGPAPGNPWRGYRLCLQAIPTQATHVVIIQDDAIVCQNFAPAVERVIEAVPDHPVCLFIPGRVLRTHRAIARSPKTLVLLHRQDFVPVVAVLWPRAKAEHFLTWTQTAKLPGIPNPRSDDAVAGVWMRFTKQAVYATVPSLVQHPDDAPSVKDGPHRAANGADASRVAFAFCEGDALELEWHM